MKNFNNRVAVVTGAGGGLGRELSISLSQKGCDLALVDINEAGLNETASMVRKNGRKASIHVTDVSNKDQMAALAEAVIAEYGHVHILINNAGVIYYGSIEEQSVEDFQWIVGINFMGIVYGCKFFLPYLKKEDEAHIVNLSSMMGFMGAPVQAAYSATKSATRAFSESLWAELYFTKVGVTVVQPGAIRTNILKTSRGSSGDPSKQKLINIIDRVAITPERAAQKIIRAVEKKKMRCLMGVETYLTEWSKRLCPVWVHYPLAWIFRLVRKG